MTNSVAALKKAFRIGQLSDMNPVHYPQGGVAVAKGVGGRRGRRRRRALERRIAKVTPGNYYVGKYY